MINFLKKYNRNANRERVGAFIQQGDFARDLRDWPIAARRYAEALKIDPSLTGIWVQMGHALKESGELWRAEEAYRKAIVLVPDDAENFLQLGHCLKLKGDASGAAKAYGEAERLSPADPHIRREAEMAKKNFGESKLTPPVSQIENIPNSQDISSLTHSARLAHLVWYQWPPSIDTEISLKKVCIYVTYSEKPLIKETHNTQVNAFKEAGYFVVSVVASDYAPDDNLQFSLGDLTIVKKNIGYDFGSWWVGYKTISKLLGHRIYEVEKFALCNDSYLGAISSDEIHALEDRSEWLVGISNSPQLGSHMQSYFTIAQHDYVKTGKFSEFITNYPFPKEKQNVIKYGELLLSYGDNISTYATHDYNHLVYLWVSQMQEMKEEEYIAKTRFGLHADSKEIEKDFESFFSKLRLGHSVNPTHAFWRQIVQSGSSILKTELLIKNPIDVPNWCSALAHCIDNPTLARSLQEIQQLSAKPKDQHTAILLGLLKMASATQLDQKKDAENASWN